MQAMPIARLTMMIEGFKIHNLSFSFLLSSFASTLSEPRFT